MMMPGGGLSGGKLTLADADVSDVVAGKKFYAGDKVIKTGTLELSGDAAAGQVKSGCTFYNSDPKNKVTGTWVPVFVQVGSNNSHGEDAPRINVTVSGYSEYYCTHSQCGGSVDVALSWSASEGTFQSSNTWIGNGAFRKLTGCNPNHSVTIYSFLNHDTGGWAQSMSIWAIK